MSSDEQPLHNKPASANDGAANVKKQPTCTKFCVYKVLVFLYALLFLLMGLVLFIAGICVLIIKDRYDSVSNMLTSPAAVALVVGIIIIVSAVCGFIGVIKEHLICLRIFLVIAILVFILQVIIGIIAFVDRENAVDYMSKDLRYAIEEYTRTKAVERAMDKVQMEFKCCGMNGVDDWERNDHYSCGSESELKCSVPWSCCKDPVEDCGLGLRSNTSIQMANVIYTDGCRILFLSWVEENYDILGAVALGFAIIHLLGIFMVYLFITKVVERRVLFKYRKRVYEQD